VIDNAVDYERIRDYFLVPMTKGAPLRTLLLGLAACMAFSGLAKGEVVYNNLNTANTGTSKAFDGSSSPTSGWLYWAQKFKVNSNTNTLDWVSLNLYQTNSTSNANFDVKIYNSSGADPGTAIYTLASGIGVSSLGGQKSSVWSIGGGINLGATTLNSGQDYWIVVNTSAGDANFLWAQGPSNPTGLGSSGTNNNIAWATDSGYNFGGQIAVPEPGTLLLGTLAACSGAAGAWWKRRKRKATQPETTDQPATA
jgi:hypothetical protein